MEIAHVWYCGCNGIVLIYCKFVKLLHVFIQKQSCVGNFSELRHLRNHRKNNQDKRLSTSRNPKLKVACRTAYKQSLVIKARKEPIKIIESKYCAI
ncbi:hypothetical protein M758_11G076400 [Ceratodon purpureus]|uniref:Uncharacterized protein n=1 Tax=Ceratodon purpureus TaxID=3225 RepID=A0A8T0GI04_CERPU|nr:hypothetical protein KC19_11G078900 [Ceratodon purpureus]KAG0600995.1 hypothetical protein M758_11G076400 [Ceratodon purpureus]